MNILMICHRIPYPPNKGEKIRSFHMLRYLAARHRVVAGFLVDDSADLVHVDFLLDMVHEARFALIDHPFRRYRTALAALATGKPVSVPFFYSRKLQRELDELLERWPVDAIFCSCSPTAEYVYKSRHWSKWSRDGRPCLFMDLMDVDSEKWRQYATETSGFMRAVYRREATRLLAYEAEISRRYDRVFLTSEAERAVFIAKTGAPNAHGLPNGVDVDFFTPEYAPNIPVPPGPALVFTGAMDYRPNVEGAVWFVRRVLPLIRRRSPEIRLDIVGAGPAPEVLSLARTPGVRVTGFVSDVRDYIAPAATCVVPLFTARGVQNKVLEGMSMAKPVITTPQGLEGLRVAVNREILVATTPEGFADHVSSIVEDPGRAMHIGRSARERVIADYGWNSHLALFNELM